MTFRDVRLGQAFVGVRYTGTMKVPRYHFDDTGQQVGQELVDSEEFLTVDASVARSFSLGSRGSKVRLQVGVRNLTDAYQEDIDQGPYRDSDFVYGPRFPRSFYVTTSYVY